jgi:hypothetical protein
MSSPTVTKTWQFNLNNYAPADATTAGGAHFNRRNMLLGIKNAFKGFGTQPWTVTSSSDSSTTSASDLWVDEGDLVWRDDDTASAFSWIVLRQTGVSTTFEILITCEQDTVGNDGAQIGAWVAQAGFTGGSTTARPTATDERILRDSTLFGQWGSGANGTTGQDYRYHVMQSTDGQCTRVLIFINGVNTGFWIFDVPANPVSGWSNPYIAAIEANNDNTTNQATYARWYDFAAARSYYGGTEVTMYFSGEGFLSAGAGELITVPNQITGGFVASQIGLHSLSSSFTGRMGEITDLWWGYSFADTGRYYPSTAAKAFVQVSDLIFPWDGSSLLGTS